MPPALKSLRAHGFLALPCDYFHFLHQIKGYLAQIRVAMMEENVNSDNHRQQFEHDLRKLTK
jgi:hypothetical protein